MVLGLCSVALLAEPRAVLGRGCILFALLWPPGQGRLGLQELGLCQLFEIVLNHLIFPEHLQPFSFHGSSDRDGPLLIWDRDRDQCSTKTCPKTTATTALL